MIKQKSKVAVRFVSFLAMGLLILNQFNLVFAADENTDFNVNVREVLSVSITTPTTWASGDIDTFLRNPISLDIVTNNANGFTASMTTKTNDTSLINTSKNSVTLPTLSASTTRANFPANYWGYSLDDTPAGNTASNYAALVGAGSTPITILASNSAATGHKDFYFGAKANVTKASGTYSGTVVISVVSGVIDNNTNPVIPTNPDTPNPTPNTATYNPTHGTTTYTYTNTNSGSNTTTTTTEVSSGDSRSVYEGYTPPQGVTYSTTSRVSNLSTLTTGLAIASSVAATSGAFFLFAARREEDDDDGDNDEVHEA